MIPPLEEFLAYELFSTLDRHLAKQIATVAGAQSRLAGHAAALASAMLRRGHVCADLRQPPQFNDEVGLPTMPWPQIAEWRGDLLASGVVASDGRDFKPLVLDAEGRLYLHRYYEYERRLATAIGRRAEAGRFRVIVGGPGTGKTTRILDELVTLAVREPAPRIELAAPTGKAAQRMEESIAVGLGRLTLDAAILARIPRSASTLHRLLGARSDSAFFRHNASRPLPADVVIVDEASMVDLPLMAKLFDALHADAEVILVGDPDQLASVEAGAVLADIATAAQQCRDPLSGLGRALTTLTQQHRYAAESGIGKLCNAIRIGDADAVLDTLTGGDHVDVRLRPLPGRDALATRLQDSAAVTQLQAALSHGQPADILRELGRSRILCPTRRGTAGVESINEIIAVLLEDKGVLRAAGASLDRRPIVLTRNDHGLQLFNGDTGVIIAAASEDRTHRPLQAFFPGAGDTLRSVPAVRLPPHETAFAMTVHRSQGSEFDAVLLILPPMTGPLLTRELLYTAVSRARRDVEIWGDAETLRAACARRVARTSGLADRLLEENAR